MVSLYKLQEGDGFLGDIKIKKYNDYFEIMFTEKYSCLVSDFGEKSFIVKHRDNLGIFYTFSMDYEKIGVKNINELFLLLVKKPREIIKLLTENDIPVYRLIIEYFL
jgi:hypothetical protein